MQNSKLKEENYKKLKEFAHDWGADLFGVADVSKIKNEFKLSSGVLKGIDMAVSLAVRLSKSIIDEIESHPTKLYFHHYRAINAFLDQLAIRITNFIQAEHWRAIAIPASQIIDWERQTAHLAHKKIAHLAGLGWIGRNNLLVNETLGSLIRLTTVLTDMPLKTDSPVEGGCGDCRACIPECPVGAVKERKEDFDHIKCFEKLKEFQKNRFVDQYICGICLKNCPSQH